MAMLTLDRSLPFRAVLIAASSWPSLSWLNARDPLRETGAAAADEDEEDAPAAADDAGGGVLLEPLGLFEQAADKASSATAGIATSAFAVVLMCFFALRVMGD
jgi:hypothetical protein